MARLPPYQLITFANAAPLFILDLIMKPHLITVT